MHNITKNRIFKNKYIIYMVKILTFSKISFLIDERINPSMNRVRKIFV